MLKIIISTLIAGIIIFVVFFGLHFFIKSKAEAENKNPSVNVTTKKIAGTEITIKKEPTWQVRVNQENHPVSVAMLAAFVILQFFAMALAKHVITEIKKDDSASFLKSEKLKNADIFFDLPLYIGLAGTVFSFIIITFSPQMGRLIAYSSTIFGIIISVILRLVFVYPLKQKLTAEYCAEKSN